MSWITVPILCVVDDLDIEAIEALNESLKNLKLPVNEIPVVETEIREAELNTDLIVTYYPANNPDRTIVETMKGNYSVVLKKNELKALIANAKDG